jgi:hypothetical protein
VIRFLLQEIERNPNALFSRSELVSLSQSEFDILSLRKILVYHRPPEGTSERIRSPRCQHGCALTVIEKGDGYEAVCLDHPEEDPIPIPIEALNRYKLSIENLLSEIKSANEIEGPLKEISGGYFHFGYKFYNDIRVGCVFISNLDGAESIKLPGLKSLCQDDNALTVFTPVSRIDELELKKLPKHESILQISLADHLDPKTFLLPIDKLVRQFIELKPGIQDGIVKLTERQKCDYTQQNYLCYDKVFIPGGVPESHSNLLSVNDTRVIVPDWLFILFLRFVAELKKNQGGWVNIWTLKEENLIPDQGRYQIYSNLRAVLSGALLDKDGKKFIQSDHSKNYRISTHPDFITYDRHKLLKHPDARISKIAAKLP